MVRHTLRRWSCSPKVQRIGQGAIELRLPKYGSESNVPIPDELVQVFAAHVEQARCNTGLFTGAEEDPPHQNTVGHGWRTTLRAADRSGIRLHDLRHFYASGLISAGCDVVTVQRALGHTKPTTTL